MTHWRWCTHNSGLSHHRAAPNRETFDYTSTQIGRTKFERKLTLRTTKITKFKQSSRCNCALAPHLFDRNRGIVKNKKHSLLQFTYKILYYCIPITYLLIIQRFASSFHKKKKTFFSMKCDRRFASHLFFNGKPRFMRTRATDVGKRPFIQKP